MSSPLRSALVILATFAALLAAIASCTPTAHAADVQTVTVVADVDVQGGGWRLDAAIASWNAAQTGVRFVRSTTADVTSVRVHRYSADDSMGGYTLGLDVWLNERYHPRSTWRTAYTRCMSAQIVAHELGHALGLQHSTSLADLMYGGPRPGPRSTCGQPSTGDVAALAALSSI